MALVQHFVESTGQASAFMNYLEAYGSRLESSQPAPLEHGSFSEKLEQHRNFGSLVRKVHETPVG